MGVQGITVSILTAPAEVIHHQVFVWKLGDAAVKSGQVAEQKREFGAGFTGQDGVVFAHFALEGGFIEMEKQGNFIALGIAVNHTKPALHQVFHGCNHIVAKTNIVWRFKVMCFFGQPGKAAPIDARDHIQSRQHAHIGGALKDAHLCIQIVKFHLHSLITNSLESGQSTLRKTSRSLWPGLKFPSAAREE